MRLTAFAGLSAPSPFALHHQQGSRSAGALSRHGSERFLPLRRTMMPGGGSAWASDSFLPRQLFAAGGGGPVDVETLKAMEPRSNITETIVFVTMMAAFAYIRLKFDRAVAARQARVDAEEELRLAKSANIAGEGKEGMPYDIPAMEIAVEKLKKKEAEEKALFPGSQFDVRIPALPKDEEDVSRERVAQLKGKAPPMQEEERLAPWQEALLVGSLTILLLPVFLFSLADPMKPPVPGGAVEQAMQREVGADGVPPAPRLQR